MDASAPNPFDEVFRLLTPSRLLNDPRARGQGVRVCVLDTGVDRELVEQRMHARGMRIEPIRGGIFSSAGGEPAPYLGRHSAPHGTTVADIILTIAPCVELWSADVFGPSGSCEVDTLMHALRWAIERWQCKIVNLSLGVSESRLLPLPRRQQLLRAIEDAYYRDVLVFAAAHNEHPLVKSFPAVFAPALFSVDKHLFAEALQFAYRLREQVEFQAHGRGYVGPFRDELATSWAAPHLAGIAARILSLRPTMKPFELKTILYWLAQHQDAATEERR